MAAFKRPIDITDPMPLKTAISKGIERDAFPYVDSRTRYWRYYLLLGRKPNPKSTVALGRRLIMIAKENGRGIGRNLFSLHHKQNKSIKNKSYKRLASRFLSEYRVAKDFWRYAERSNDGLVPLAAASAKVRAATIAESRGFFRKDGPLRLGHARNAFHRIIREQSPSSQELAKLLDLKKMNLTEVVLSANFSKLSEELGCMLLVWALLPALYRNLQIADLEEDVEEDQPEGAKELAELANVAIRGLKAGRGSDLDAVTRERLIQLLREARARATRTGLPYSPPLKAPPLQPGRKRQRLFADLRLSSFARLLSSTN